MNSTDLLNIVNALAIARGNEFMSREHAAIIWKKLLKDTDLDVARIIKPTSPITQEGVVVDEKSIN